MIAPASPEMMAMVHSAQQMPKVTSAPASAFEEVPSLLSIKLPASSSTPCYCCKKGCDDYFCSEACELYYDTLMDHGLRTPDFVCEDCGYYMNPREGTLNRICQGCQYHQQEEYYDETEYMSTAERYRYMWPQTKSHPHDFETARHAIYEFLDCVNDAHGEVSKAEQARFLFHYLADHGQYVLKTASFATAILEKMVEFESKEGMMRLFDLGTVFDRLRKMIGEIETKKE